ARGGSSPALEQFRRIRAGSEAAVPAQPAPAPGGVRGRVQGLLGAQKVTPRQVADSAHGADRLVPQVDRDTLLARLRSVRALFAGGRATGTRLPASTRIRTRSHVPGHQNSDVYVS